MCAPSSKTLEEADISGFWWKLLHLVNHASYYRGQVTTMLRQLGADAPKSQDLIMFQKERALAALDSRPS